MIILSEVNQRKAINLFTKQKQTHRHRRQIYGYQRGKGRGEVNWEFGINMYMLLHLKQANKDPPCSTGNCMQYLIVTYNGKESEKEQVYTET